MKRYVETASFTPEGDPREQIDSLRVVNWNINRGLKLGGIIDFLQHTAADLVLLQETDINARRTQYRNIPREIAQALRMEYVFGYEFEELTQSDGYSPAYHGQTTLSRLPISASRILPFRRQSGFWRPRWFIPELAPLQRRLGARMALVTHIDWPEKPLVVYNVHLESRGNDDLRASQLRDLVDDTDRYGSDVPVLIAGDFNFDLSRMGVVESFQMPFNRGKSHPTTTQSRFDSGRAVDWIVFRGPVEDAVPEVHDRVRASDHYPLSLILKLKEVSRTHEKKI